MPRANLSGKTILITGATGGIGLAAADGLARMGAAVLLHGRTQAAAQAACAALAEAHPAAQLQAVWGDLADPIGRTGLVDQLERDHPLLDMLVWNAGIFLADQRWTSAGLELQWAVNAVAPAEVIDALLARGRLASSARLILVSSRAHRRGRAVFSPRGLPPEHGRSGIAAYCHSKLAMSLYARELADRLPHGMGVASLHPGIVASGLFRHFPLWLKSLVAVISPFFASIEEGARGILLMAAQKDHPAPRGGYFAHGVPARAHAALTDAAARAACVGALAQARTLEQTQTPSNR